MCDRGCEFADVEGIAGGGTGGRGSSSATRYIASKRAAQNHVELRKCLPKGRTDFAALTQRDMAVCMSCVNSYVRESLSWVASIDLAEPSCPELLTGLGGEGLGLGGQPDAVPHPAHAEAQGPGHQRHGSIRVWERSATGSAPARSGYGLRGRSSPRASRQFPRSSRVFGGRYLPIPRVKQSRPFGTTGRGRSPRYPVGSTRHDGAVRERGISLLKTRAPAGPTARVRAPGSPPTTVRAHEQQG